MGRFVPGDHTLGGAPPGPGGYDTGSRSGIGIGGDLIADEAGAATERHCPSLNNPV
jgi:hypothetical protein